MAVNVAPVDDTTLALECARLYYLEDRSKIEIAQRMGLSRFKVARLLEEARRTELVRIEITDDAERVLGQQLVETLGLREAVVVGDSAPDRLASAGAEVLARALTPASVLGLGWGRSVDAVVRALPPRPTVPDLQVVQLAGGLDGATSAFDPTAVAARAAQALGAKLLPLHAPAYLASAATRRSLLREAGIARAHAAFQRLDVVLIGIGAIGADPDASQSAVLESEALTPEDVARLRGRGAVGDVVCHFLDARGRPLRLLESRTMAVGLADLCAPDVRIGVAAGPAKVDAVAAAVAAGVVNVLVTDRETAGLLLQH